ncbi:MAG: hypothetical protein JXA54_13580 [Candidatus Heimdallarchaeota archaeon]|nr:hypothetical protein [Candidatus Heimdallarchaeota archaeon]
METKIVTKIAADINSKKLGKIIRIDLLDSKTIKKKIPYAIIEVRNFLKPDVLVPLETEKIKKIEGNYTWFDITLEEFRIQVSQIRALKKNRETFQGVINQQQMSNRFWTGIDPSGLSNKNKERKR